MLIISKHLIKQCIVKAEKLIYNHFFSALLQNALTSGFQGRNSSSISGSSRNLIPGRNLNIYLRYSYGLILFALAVSPILYTAALALAPSGLPENSQLRRPTVNGLMLFSARLLLIAMYHLQGIS
jgi:hypothetical protein